MNKNNWKVIDEVRKILNECVVLKFIGKDEREEIWGVKKKKLVVILWFKWGLRIDFEFNNVVIIGDYEMINFMVRMRMRVKLE